MLVRTTLVALLVLLVATAAERSPTAADRPTVESAAAVGAAPPVVAAATAAPVAHAAPSASHCLAGLPLGPIPGPPGVDGAAPAAAPLTDADGAEALTDRVVADVRDPHPADPVPGAAVDAVDPYPTVATAADGAATPPPGEQAVAAATPPPTGQPVAGSPAPPSDGQPVAASTPPSGGQPVAGVSAPPSGGQPVAGAATPPSGGHAGSPSVDGGATVGDAARVGAGNAATLDAAAGDDLGSLSRRSPGLPHPLPVTRPDDAVMRVALARLAQPGDRPATEASLPTSSIGQTLMVGFEGDDVTDPGPRRLAAHIRAGRVGGVLFFKRNIKSAAAVKALTAMFQDAARAAPGGLPLFVAVDQEGGLVQRLDPSVGFPATPSAAALAAEGEAAAAAAYRTLAQSLAAWGFNLNLGPVVDLGFNDANPVVTRLGRAFAPDPDTVTRFAELFIDAHRAAGVLTAIKHFPGHGSSDGDTHRGFVDVTKTFRAEEMVPFERLIAAGGADMVMVAHVENGLLDPEKRPATLSPAVVDDVLRKRCGFEGVVITDDMEMAAIAKLAATQDVTAEAIGAGSDILVYGSGVARGGDLVALLHARIRIAAEDPAILRRVADSAARIASLKAKLPR